MNVSFCSICAIAAAGRSAPNKIEEVFIARRTQGCKDWLEGGKRMSWIVNVRGRGLYSRRSGVTNMESAV